MLAWFRRYREKQQKIQDNTKKVIEMLGDNKIYRHLDDYKTTNITARESVFCEYSVFVNGAYVALIDASFIFKTMERRQLAQMESIRQEIKKIHSETLSKLGIKT
jgi:hypothetical protein